MQLKFFRAAPSQASSMSDDEWEVVTELEGTLNLEEEVQQKGYGPCDFFTDADGGEKVTDTWLQEGGQDAKVVFAVLKSPAPIPVIEDGADLKQLVIKGCASEPQFDQDRLLDTAEGTLNLEEEVQQKGDGPRNFLTDGGEKVTDTCRQACGQDAKVVFAVPKSPTPPRVIDDGADLKQLVINGCASEPQFDQERLLDTAEGTLNLEEEMQQKGGGHRNFLTDGGEKVTDTCCQAGGQDAKVVFAVPKSPTPPRVIGDGADLKQLVIKGCASEPQFDQERLLDTAEGTLNLEEEMQEKGGGHRNFLTDGGEKVTDICRQAGGQDAKVVFAVPKSPTPPFVIDDGEETRQLVIKGWACEPQFDPERLLDTANRMKYLNMNKLTELRDELGESTASLYVDTVIAELEAYTLLMEPLVLHTMQIHTFVQRLASLASHTAVEKMCLEAACQDFKITVNEFRRKTETNQSLKHLQNAIDANNAARKSLKSQGHEGELQDKVMIACGVCCVGLAVYSGAACACISTVKASAVATNPCLAWLTKTVHSVSSITTTHTTGAGVFKAGSKTSMTTTKGVTNIVYQPWGKEALSCSAGLGSLLGLFAGPSGVLRSRERSSSRHDAQQRLESVRKALVFLKEEWNGLHVSCSMLTDYFNAPDPKTFKMLGMEGGPKLLAARNCIEKFMVMLWMTQSMPANMHESIPHFIGESRFECIRGTFDVNTLTPSRAKLCRGDCYQEGLPKCFLPNSIFLRPDGTIVRAAELRADGSDVLQGPAGARIQVTATRHRAEPRNFVRLTTDKTMLEITDDHRLIIEDGDGKSLVVEAKHVRPLLIRTGVDQEITLIKKVEHFSLTSEVVEIACEYDQSLLVWTPMAKRVSKVNPNLCFSVPGAPPRSGHNFQVRSTFLEVRTPQVNNDQVRSSSLRRESDLSAVERRGLANARSHEIRGRGLKA